MRQRIRNRSMAAGSVTRAERDALEKLASKWRTNALSTEPVDCSKVIAMVKARYRIGGLEEPSVVVVSSPLVMSLVAGAMTGLMVAENTGVRSMHDAQRFGIESGGRVLPRVLRQVMAASPIGIRTLHSSRDSALPLGDDVITAIILASQAIPAFGDESWLPPGLRRENSFNGERWPTQGERTGAALDDVASLHDSEVLENIRSEVAAAVGMLAGNREAHRHRHVEMRMESHRQVFFQPVDMITALFQNLGDVFDISPQLLKAYWIRTPYRVNFGNFSSDQAFFSEAMHEVFGIQDSKTEEQEAWEAYCLGSGMCLPFERFCVVSDRPERVCIDDNGRLHNDGGAAIQWRDGVRMNYWHGMFVPRRLDHAVHNPDDITLQDIENEQNVEQRRMMLELYGIKRYVSESDVCIVDEMPGDHCIPGFRSACLLKKNMGQGESPLYFINLLNSTPEPDGTYRRYLLRVDPSAYDGEAARNVHAAAASTWRNADGSLAFDNWLDYMPTLES